MPNPNENSQRNESLRREKKPCNCRYIRNGLLFSFAAVAVGAAIYYGIKENKRLKQEKELLEYEIWG